MADVPTHSTTNGEKHTFIRSYQACVPCRKRKVKCDLGDPGSPSDPPCRRCRREHKDCYFQDLRTRKASPPKVDRDVGRSKRIRFDTAKSSTAGSHVMSDSRVESSLADDLFTSTASGTTHLGASLSPKDSAAADRILHKEVHNANEALNLLYEAAAEGRFASDDGKTNLISLDHRSLSSDDPNTAAWRDFWCVKAGWMTSNEARDYINLFFPSLFHSSSLTF
jgi:Fungal Zn(2)-Cys(6) binuclear cluster domain